MHLGFIFQSFNLIPVLSAYENVSFALSLITTRPQAGPFDGTMAILDDVGLGGHGRTAVRASFPAGQQQRVAIARALVKNPDIVLADEPTANVDSEIGEGLLELMRARSTGATRPLFCFPTHDAMVMEFADRLVRLHDGRITARRDARAAGGRSDVRPTVAAAR